MISQEFRFPLFHAGSGRYLGSASAASSFLFLPCHAVPLLPRWAPFCGPKSGIEREGGSVCAFDARPRRKRTRLDATITTAAAENESRNGVSDTALSVGPLLDLSSLNFS